MQKYFFIKSNGSYVKINFADILFIEGCKNYIKIVTVTKSFMVLLSMIRMEQLLASYQFVRIHKSYIISLEHVTEFNRNTVYLKEKILPIGCQFKGAIEKLVVIAQEESITQLMAVPLNYLTQKVHAG